VRQVDAREQAVAMRESPGKWFIVSFQRSEHSARARASQFRSGRCGAFAPPGFEFEADSINGLPVVLGRFLSE
jgi:hypothetical protein